MELTPQDARKLAGTLLEGGPDAEGAGGEPDASAVRPGAFGRYRVVRLIGAGGMGEVYEAEQESPHRRVAIKTIRPELLSPELARRFDLEARVLARLQHPGIAQVYEAGQVRTGAGATPYFAMEYVEGRPLTEFARGAALPVRERLELFLRVCEAVEHAHQRGVIHRDLKPANILIDAGGRARVLDFGVARATDADVRATTIHTEAGRLVGTLPYMSPEQVAGDAADLDTRSDVYSLGVVLYELLAGKLPYDVGRGPVAAAARTIAEAEPAPLSSADRAYRGDLDTIVGKALAKEKDRRYQSVSALAADLRRFLADEPIEARPASAMYQIRKFARRNSGLVLGLAVAAGVLVIGAAASATFAVREASLRQVNEDANRQLSLAASKAREEADRAHAVVGFLRSMLSAVGPAIAKGRDTELLRGVVDETAARLDREFGMNPRARAELLAALGSLYDDLGHYDTAQRMLEESLALEPDLEIEAPEHWAARLGDLGAVLRHRGDLRGAQEQFETALKRLSDLGRGAESNVPRLLHSLGECLYARGELAEAESRLQQSLAMHRQLGEGGVEAAAFNLTIIGRIARERSDLPAAEGHLREALAILQELHPEGHPETGSILGTLGQVLLEQRKLSDAEEMAQEALNVARQMHGEEHRAVAICTSNLALVIHERGDDARAEQMYRQAIAMHERLDPKDPNIANPMSSLATMLRSRGDHAGSAQLYERVLEVDRRVYGDRHPKTARTMLGLARVRGAMGDWASAEDWGRKALDVFRAFDPPDRRDIGYTTRHLAQAIIELGRLAEAEVFARESVEMLQHLRADPGEMGFARCLLGRALTREQSASIAEGVTELEGGVEQLRQSKLGISRVRLSVALEWLAVGYERSGQSSRAAEIRQGNPADAGGTGRDVSKP